MEPGARLSTAKKAAFSAVAVLIFVTATEVLLRIWVYYFRDEYARIDVLTGAPYLVPGVHQSGTGAVVVNSMGFVGKELEADGPDLWRIAALGDSNTFGHGSPTHAYPAVLNELLDARERPGRRYEVVNAGIEGLDSSQALDRLRLKVLPLAPRVVIIYVGWNDLMKGDPFGQARIRGAARVSRALDRLWLIKGIRKLVFVQLRPRIDPPATGPASRTGQFEMFAPLVFEENLREIVGEARRGGASPVVMTLKTVVRAEDTAADLVNARVFFPYFPSGYAVGDFLDLIAAYNRAIRKVAVEESVPVVDLERVFREREDFRSLFIDTMHPTSVGYELVARSVLQVLEDESLLGSNVSR